VRYQWVRDLSKELAGIVYVSYGRESQAGQEIEGNGGVLKETCTDNAGVDLEQMGLLGARFYERKQLRLLLFVSLGLSLSLSVRDGFCWDFQCFLRLLRGTTCNGS